MDDSKKSKAETKNPPITNGIHEKEVVKNVTEELNDKCLIDNSESNPCSDGSCVLPGWDIFDFFTESKEDKV